MNVLKEQNVWTIRESPYLPGFVERRLEKAGLWRATYKSKPKELRPFPNLGHIWFTNSYIRGIDDALQHVEGDT